MKTIVLVRHSKAVAGTADIADYYRPLKKKGKTESKAMALKFIESGLIPELLISSPALRALETAIEFAKVLKYPEKNIKHEESIYFAHKGSVFMDFLQVCENNCNTVMIFGHEPTFSDFAAYLIKNFKYGFPKTGILAIDFKVEKWTDIKKSSGSKRFFMVPDDKNLENYKLY